MITKTPISNSQNLIPDIFLAGGVSNSPDWQKEALDVLSDTNLVVANPRLNQVISHSGDGALEQITWEFINLKSAKVILFWFPNAETVVTFLELGKALARGDNIIIGIDPAYHRRFDVETQVHLEAPDTPIYQTLAETVKAAVRALNTTQDAN